MSYRSQTLRSPLRRRILGVGAAATMSRLVMAAEPSSTSFPTRPVQFVVPYAAGGPMDVFTRVITKGLAETWQQPLIVENKPGASATIGTEFVARAAPDGYTLLIANVGEICILPALQSDVRYDPVTDLTGISLLANSILCLATNPKRVPASDMAGLLAYTKAQKQPATYGSVGENSVSHIAGEILSARSGIPLLQVPYKGGAPVVNALLAGEIDMAFIGMSIASQYVAAGQLRVLGTTGPVRSALTPQIPAIAETLPGYQINSWYGLLAPKATPPALVDAIYGAVAKAIRTPDVEKFMKTQILEPVASTPAQFQQTIRDDLLAFKELGKHLKPR